MKKTTTLTRAQKLKRFRTALVRAVNKHLKNGGTVISGAYRTGGGCCPIQCLMGESHRVDTKAVSDKLKMKLGSRDLGSFIRGFDDLAVNYPELSTLTEHLYYELGQELRQRYLITDKES